MKTARIIVPKPTVGIVSKATAVILTLSTGSNNSIYKNNIKSNSTNSIINKMQTTN
jgi:hypothetical protein